MHGEESRREMMELELMLTGGAQSLSDLAHDGPLPEQMRRPIDLSGGRVIGRIRYNLKTHEFTHVPLEEGTNPADQNYAGNKAPYREKSE